MILPTTFILTLFLAPIARAVPQPCRDSIYPGSSTPVGQYDLGGPQPLLTTYKAVYNPRYDNPTDSLYNVACKNLVKKYPQFHDIPTFPFIGGAINTTHKSKNCGAIWRISNIASDQFTYFVSIDDSSSFDLSEHAFLKLGGEISVGSIVVDVTLVGNIGDTT